MGCGGSVQNEKKEHREDIRDNYILGVVLGSGSFGQVHKATHKVTGEVRAVKIFERDDVSNETRDFSKIASFRREVDTLRSLNHENIIIFFDFYEDPEFMYVVMELCTGGELFERVLTLRRFKEADASFLARQMLQAIEYIHSRRVVHRDIKAENFIFSSDDIKSPIKMIDFGMACVIHPGTYLTNLCGSPHYLAPEIIGQRYTEAVDLWSYGILIYLILYGKYPFDAQDRKALMIDIILCKVEWIHPVAKPSKNALEHMKKLLTTNIKARMTASQALYDKWIVDWATAKSTDVEKAPEIKAEVLKTAHRASTAFRAQMDQNVEKLRLQKLKEIENKYARGEKQGTKIDDRLNASKEHTQHPAMPITPDRRQDKIGTSPVVRRTSMVVDLIGRGTNKVRHSLSIGVAPPVLNLKSMKLSPINPVCEEEDEGDSTDIIRNKSSFEKTPTSKASATGQNPFGAGQLALPSVPQPDTSRSGNKLDLALAGKLQCPNERPGGGRLSYCVGGGSQNVLTLEEQNKYAQMFDALQTVAEDNNSEEEEDEESEDSSKIN